MTTVEPDPTQSENITNSPTSTQPSPISMPLIGVEPHAPGRESVQTMLSESGAQIIRYNGVLWHEVEAQQGTYDWSVLQELETGLEELAARGIDVILIVRGAPEWAQKVQGSFCGPVAQEHLQAYADFLTELVNRYSNPPYNVKYWELGNEPDIAPELMSANSAYGCWGDSEAPNYGGAYYADMLKAVYPAIKSADPEAQVLVGGLLLDCDPDYPPEDMDCTPSLFLDGILQNEGGEYFDIVSYHGYVAYIDGSFSSETENPAWKTRGGSVLGKAEFIRSTLQKYGYSKPIFLTESSLLCPEWNADECNPPDEQFFETQADYLVRTYVRNWAHDIDCTIWYSFEGGGWRHGGLVGPDMANPKPAYRAFTFLNQILAGLELTKQENLSEALESYVFEGNDRQVWVVWSKDQLPSQINLPQNIESVYDIYGQEISSDQGQVSVSAPLYFELSP